VSGNAELGGRGLEDDQRLLQDLVPHAELREIRVVRWHGDLESSAKAPAPELTISARRGFRIRDNEFDCRYEMNIPIQADDDSPMAKIEVVVVAHFAVPQGRHPDKEAVRKYTESVGYLIAMPFIREAVQTISVRLGLEPLTLGLLEQGQHGPATAAFRSKLKLAEDSEEISRA
jgi:hypothetical protein